GPNSVSSVSPSFSPATTAPCVFQCAPSEPKSAIPGSVEALLKSVFGVVAHHVFWSQEPKADTAACHTAAFGLVTEPSTMFGGCRATTKTLGLAAFQTTYAAAQSVCICKTVR